MGSRILLAVSSEDTYNNTESYTSTSRVSPTAGGEWESVPEQFRSAAYTY